MPSKSHRLGPRLIAVLCLALLPGPVLAQGPGNAARGGEAATGAAEPEIRELESGDITATVTVLRTGRPYPAGGSAFARIELANTGKARRAQAELVFEPETAVIRDINGKDLEVSEKGTARVVTAANIARGKPRTITVELTLRTGTASDAEAEVRNRLKLALRPAGEGAAEQAATLEWPVTDCAGGFYAQIVRVREGSGANISGALEAARKRDSARPGRWLFPPRNTARKPERKCVASVRRWSQRRGRHIHICTRYETVEPTAGTPAPFEDEREVYRFAGRYVSARARDREFAPTRDTGWATRRLSQNLEGFLKQERHPAICTGIIPFFDYFDERIARFAKRAETFAEMAGKSHALAKLRTAEVIDSVKAEPGGHPGFGTAPLDLPDTAGTPGLKRLVVRLAQITDGMDADAKIADAGNTYTALRAASAYLGGEAGKALPAGRRARLYRALSAIEAADYIGTVAGHYSAIDHALLGSMRTLRQAHSHHCLCGG